MKHDVLLSLAVKIQLGAGDFIRAVSKPAVVVGVVGVAASVPALAGTGGDVLMKDAYNSTMGVATGYGGKMATGISGTFAMIGSVFKFQPQLLMSALGVGFTANGVDNLVDFTVTACI